jgi:hypothetical protein
VNAFSFEFYYTSRKKNAHQGRFNTFSLDNWLLNFKNVPDRLREQIALPQPQRFIFRRPGMD